MKDPRPSFSRSRGTPEARRAYADAVRKQRGLHKGGHAAGCHQVRVLAFSKGKHRWIPCWKEIGIECELAHPGLREKIETPAPPTKNNHSRKLEKAIAELEPELSFREKFLKLRGKKP